MRRQAIYHDIKRSALHQAGLYRPKQLRQAVRQLQATSKIFVEFDIANKSTPRSTSCESSPHAVKKKIKNPPPPPPITKHCRRRLPSAPAAAYKTKPVAATETCRHRTKTRRRCRLPAAAATKTRRRCRLPAAAATKTRRRSARAITRSLRPPGQHPAAAADPCRRGIKPKTQKRANFFCAFGSISYTDRDNLDHGYIKLGYLDIEINNIVYSYTHRQQLQSIASASSLASMTFPL
jgi:hypothetical protein